MTSPASPAARPTSPGTQSSAVQPASAPSDWTVQVVDSIDAVVGTIRDKTTKVETAARAVVYGILIAVVGTAALILTVVALVRALTYIPGAEVWMVDAGLGAIFTLAGLLCWRWRRPRDARKKG